MESPAERDLIARMTRQEPEALRDFQAAYTPLLRYIIAPILPDPRDQEECLADAIHRAWERIGQFDRTGGSFSGWLSVLARNTVLNHLRSQNRRPQWESLDGRGQLIDPAPTPEQALLQQERLQAVVRAVSGLSDRDRALFYRKYYYYQSTAQMAAELGLTERAVEGRLYRIRKRLQKELGGDDHD